MQAVEIERRVPTTFLLLDGLVLPVSLIPVTSGDSIDSSCLRDPKKPPIKTCRINERQRGADQVLGLTGVSSGPAARKAGFQHLLRLI